MKSFACANASSHRPCQKAWKCAFRLLPAHETRHPQPPARRSGSAPAARQRAAGPREGRPSSRFAQRTDFLVGVGGGSDLDRALEVLEAAPCRPASPFRSRSCSGCAPGRIEAEPLGELQGLIGKRRWPARSSAIIRTRRELLEDERLRGRRLAIVDQLPGELEVLERPVTVAPVEPHAAEPGPRLGRVLDLAARPGAPRSPRSAPSRRDRRRRRGCARRRAAARAAPDRPTARARAPPRRSGAAAGNAPSASARSPASRAASRAHARPARRAPPGGRARSSSAWR